MDSKQQDSKTTIYSALSPFKNTMFRMLWIATVCSNIGTAMHEVGAAWLMTSLAPTPIMISLMVTATSLPIVLFTLPGGAIADIFDRRLVLIITQGYMFAIAVSLGVLTIMGITNPSILLTLTFALGIGSSISMPAAIPIPSSLVPRSEMPAALTLGAIGINIGRAIGPTAGGFIVTAIAPWIVFFLNAASLISLMVVLYRLQLKSPRYGSLPPERFIEAIRSQVRYVRYSNVVHIVIVRICIFAICSSALSALLPLIAKRQLHLDPTGFGFLLGSLGMGAVICGILILPKLRTKASVELLISFGTGIFAVVMFLMAHTHHFILLCGIMGLGGIAWIMILSNLYVAGFKSAPKWVGGRVLAVYLLILNGGLAAGSLLWGIVAGKVGIPVALSVASLALAVSLIISRSRYRTTVVDELDFTPSMHWIVPQTVMEPSDSRGRVLITIEYHINPESAYDFDQAMCKLGQIRKREGIIYWELFRDVTDAGRYIEVSIAESWKEHLRQHEHVTATDRAAEEKVRKLLKEGTQPIVSHFITEHIFKAENIHQD